MTDKIRLHPLNTDDIEQILLSFKEIGWNKPKSLYENYLSEQDKGIRSILVAKENEVFCGYVTIKWTTDYPFFKQQNIPEISDLNVLPRYRKQGIGTKLLLECEDMSKKRDFTQIGLGVGLTEEYGDAQRLYVQLGYIPDGHGLYYKNSSIAYGSKVLVDDDLIIYLIKSLNKN